MLLFIIKKCQCFFQLLFILLVDTSCEGSYLEEPQKQPLPPSFLSSPSYDQQNLYYPELSSRLYQGDILEAPHDDSRNALTIEMYKWPKGEVPYEFHNTFDDLEEQNTVRKAMDGLESQSCIKFVPRKDHADYIIINKERNGCYAMVGFRPNYGKPLPVNLQSPECLRHEGTVQHELLHVLGLMHEQARPDRDNHVHILWDNVDMQYKSDFDKASNSFATTFDVPYDYKSVMHYPKYAFSKNGKDTIVAVYSKGSPDSVVTISEGPQSRGSGLLGLLQGSQRDETVDMGQRDRATNNDMEKVRRMYNCSTNTKE